MDRIKLIEMISRKVDENHNDYVDFLKDVVSKDSRIFEHGAKGCEDNAQVVIEEFLKQHDAEVRRF